VIAIVASALFASFVFAAIRSIEVARPARIVMRKQSRAQRDLRDALYAMRRRS
jgi:hypothetical protein